PEDGAVYSGEFDITKKSGVLKYELSLDKKRLKVKKRIYLRDEQGRKIDLGRVQGADIVQTRNLFWFVSDKESGGLYGFNLLSEKLEYRKRIRYKRGFYKYEEL